MGSETYNVVDVIISVFSLLITGGGLWAVFAQFKKLEDATWSNMHTKLTDQSFELLKFMADYPQSYDYFYKEKSFAEDVKEEEKTKILYIAEALTNYMEHLVLQRTNLPPNEWAVWEKFITTTLKSSIVLREFIQGKRDWYSSEFLVFVDNA